MKKDPFSYVTGFVQSRDIILGISVIDELVAAGEPDCEPTRWIVSKKEIASFHKTWNATKIQIVLEPEYQFYITGPDGIVGVRCHVSGQQQEWDEVIDSSEQGPPLNGYIRDMNFIGNHLYVAGMRRQVYRREGRDNWVRQDAGVLQEPLLTEIAGFNSIDGVDENDLYAVGFGGEIWNRKNGTWEQYDSPTNVILNKVLVVAPKQIYICGQNGLLLHGHDKQWEVIDQNLEDGNFWDMAWYREALYLSSNKAIYRLDPDTHAISPVKIGIRKKLTFGYLHTNDGLLASFGEKHILVTEDGTTWQDITRF